MEVIWAPIGGNIVCASVPNQTFEICIRELHGEVHEVDQDKDAD